MINRFEPKVVVVHGGVETGEALSRFPFLRQRVVCFAFNRAPRQPPRRTVIFGGVARLWPTTQ